MDEFYIFLLVALGLHFCLAFFDLIFKTCSFHGYQWFLDGTGLTLAPFRIHWFTSALNRSLQKWASWRPRVQLAWFSSGIWVTAILMPIAVTLVAISTVRGISRSIRSSSSHSEPLLVEPIVPGWNLPTSDFPYYIVSLLFCSVIHEMGHAMAAVREDGKLLGVSLSLYYIIPVAMTHLERLDGLPVIKQLRILCAGVWNNVFLALIAAAAASVLPWVVYPLYDFGVGVQVTQIKPGFGLEGVTGLSVGDRIVHINDCPVYEAISWQDCLVSATKVQQPGFCIPDSFIKEHDESVPAKHVANGVVDCCGGDRGSRLCFEYFEVEGEPLQLPQHSCLAVRAVVSVASRRCTAPHHCAAPLHCFVPSLDNATRLLVIGRVAKGPQPPPTPPVLFLGRPYAAYVAVSVTEFVALYGSWMPASLPEGILKLLTFISYFSLGLAILNVVPCFCLDGQAIACRLIDLLFEKQLPHASVRQAIGLSITVLGTLLLTVYIIVVLFFTAI